MLRKKNIQKVFTLELKIAFVIFLLVFLFHDFITTKIKPPVMEYVATHIDFLKFLILVVFLFCCSSLVLIVWWLEWGDKKQQSVVTKYVTQLVCANYYGDYRKTNVYKAIKTCLSKFSRDGVQEEEKIASGQKRRFLGRHVDTKRFDPKTFIWHEEITQPKADICDGTHETYFKNGRIEKQANYKNNLLDGVYRTYYEDGRLHQDGYYKEGKLDGVYKAYDEEGIPYFEMNYQKGKQEGITKIYYKTGVLQYCDTFKSGKRIFRESYNESGELIFSQQEIL